jgi:hypothetical protein
MRLAARILRRSVVFPDTVDRFGWRPGLWIAADVTYLTGGRTMINGVENQDLQSSTRYGITLSVPLAAQWSTKRAWSRGLTTRIGGNFQTVAVAARNNAMAPWARRDGWSWSCPGFANGLQRGLQCSHAWRRARLHDAVISKTW